MSKKRLFLFALCSEEKRGSGYWKLAEMLSQRVQGEEKVSYGGKTRKENSKPNSGLKTKWIEYSEYVGRW